MRRLYSRAGHYLWPHQAQLSRHSPQEVSLAVAMAPANVQDLRVRLGGRGDVDTVAPCLAHWITLTTYHRWELLYSGYYGPLSRPSYRAWLYQLSLYVTIAMVEKGVVLLVLLLPFWSQVRNKRPGIYPYHGCNRSPTRHSKARMKPPPATAHKHAQHAILSCSVVNHRRAAARSWARQSCGR